MRYFQRICVANSPSTPFNPLLVQYSHAYAYLGLTPNTQSHSPKPLPNPLSPTHMPTNTYHLRIFSAFPIPTPRLTSITKNHSHYHSVISFPAPPPHSVSVFDNHRFKTAFNEELYNTIVKNKKVIAECCIDLDEDEYPEVREQIALRGWRRLSAPKQEISIDLIHEFYANAVVTEEEMEKAGGHTFRSFVRGVPVDFSPGNIRTVMRFRTQVQGAATDFKTRKEHNKQLDQVLTDLCIPRATWKLSTGQLRVPIQLRR
ncbi:hypothetical protein PIB30_067982 [Stylosanthes scabra]|uniref:Putative plant transposon protein domain-containing protein n=1 Tax=Stylosanthes scabra TaxID=79078 RepID=A0ABU6XL36_9FABA|nr:hypothetical protein [Stylosanthes scabra]